MRFSDEKLVQFHEEFKDHVAEYKERQRNNDECVQALIKAQQKNTDAIATLIEETRDIIQLHRDLQGATRVGKSVQGFAVWLAKWGTIGVGLAAIWNWGIKNLMNIFT